MKKGFTLIELLIVIAIIAILALIAVPNFLEAQVRAKVSRAHSDERTIAVAVESYTVDWGRPPFGGNEGKNIFGWNDAQRDRVFNVITTPVAYLTTALADPFIDKSHATNPDQGGAVKLQKFYTYQFMGYEQASDDWKDVYARGYQYYIRSPGPSRTVGKPYFAAMTEAPNYGGDATHAGLGMVYDASNGTLSMGNLYRTNRGYFSGPNGG